MKKLKKIGFVFLFLILVITISPASAQAPSEYNKKPTTAPNTAPTASTPGAHPNTIGLYNNVNPNVSKDLHTLSQNVIIEVLSSAVCMLSGHDPLNPTTGKCLGMDTVTGKLGYSTSTGGATQMMGGLIGGTFSIPVSGAGYAQYATDNFGITKSAYAQEKPFTNSYNGIGYDRLRPLLGIWTKLRDISYLMFVLAFTVIGLAIMFRVKIDARTVMTIQNQIPKIIIALVLVTFSYAIAGFMIDIMYVLIYLLVMTANTLTPVNINVDENIFGIVNKAFNVNALNFTSFNTGIIGISGDVALSVANVFSAMAASFLDSTVGTIFKLFFTPFTMFAQIGCSGLNLVGKIPLVGGLFGGGGGACDFVDAFYTTIIGGIFAILAFLVVLIAILFTLFRVWFTLVRSFAYVIIDALIAPLWITMGIFPGSKLSFGTWFRHLAGHLSVFPMTFAIILFGKTIMDAMGSGSTIGGITNGGAHELFNPPLIGSAVSGSNAIAAFIGFGFILSMPTILERTKKAVGAMDFGLKDLKTSIGVGTGVGMAGIKTATGDESKWKGDKFVSMGKPTQFLKNIGVPGVK